MFPASTSLRSATSVNSRAAARTSGTASTPPGRGAGNESVDQYWPALRRRAQHRAGHHRDLQPAELIEHIEGGGGTRARRGLFDRSNLAGHTNIVLTGADADAILQRRGGQAMHQQRRGSGVADTHFAERDDAGAGGNL